MTGATDRADGGIDHADHADHAGGANHADVADGAFGPRTALRGLTGRLRFAAPCRFADPRSTGPQHCELCALPIGDDHRHLADTARHVLACTCPGCALLFDGEGAAGGRLRTVPDRFLHDPDWDGRRVALSALGIPVAVAFLLRTGTPPRTVALHPGPAGAVARDVDPDAWRRAFGASPLARALADDVEALLVRRCDGRTACHLVPVDAAYDLAARLRPYWRGIDGGPRARRELASFYGMLADRAAPVAEAVGSVPGWGAATS